MSVIMMQILQASGPEHNVNQGDDSLDVSGESTKDSDVTVAKEYTVNNIRDYSMNTLTGFFRETGSKLESKNWNNII